MTSDTMKYPKPKRKTGFLTIAILPRKKSLVTDFNQNLKQTKNEASLTKKRTHPLPLKPIRRPHRIKAKEEQIKNGYALDFSIPVGLKNETTWTATLETLPGYEPDNLNSLHPHVQYTFHIAPTVVRLCHTPHTPSPACNRAPYPTFFLF